MRRPKSAVIIPPVRTAERREYADAICAYVSSPPRSLHNAKSTSDTSLVERASPDDIMENFKAAAHPRSRLHKQMTYGGTGKAIVKEMTAKEKVVEELGQIFESSGVVVVAHYAGLTVADMQDLRARARARRSCISATVKPA